MIKFNSKQNSKLLKVLCSETNLSFSLLSRKLREKEIKVNDVRVNKNIDVCEGDEIILYAESYNPEFKVIFEDANILVIVKPKGIETTSADNISAEKLLNEKGWHKALHRLDRNTEGLVVFAKNKKTYETLYKVFKNGLVKKTYMAKVFGKPKFKNGNFSAFLRKNSKAGTVMIFGEPVSGADKIETEIRFLKQNGEISTLEVKIVHGKTHQIRAHLAFLSLPIAGDGKYGNSELNKKYKLKQQELYATGINFNLKGDMSYLNDLDLSYKPNEKF